MTILFANNILVFTAGLVLLVSVVIEARGQEISYASQHTRGNEELSVFKSNCPKPLMNEAPISCPYNYHQLYFNGWTRICKPAACVEVTEVDKQSQLPKDVCLEQTDRQASTIKLCRKNALRMHHVHFITCPKVLLTDLEYKVLGNGSLWNKRDKILLQLGDYFMFGNLSVVICDQSRKVNEDSNSMSKNIIPWCIPILEATNQSVQALVQSFLDSGHTIHTVLRENTTSTIVCIDASVNISSCNIYSNLRWFYGAFKIDNNQTLSDNILLNEFSFGDYFCDLNCSTAYYCHETISTLKVRRYAYGSACILSSICLLLTIVVQALYSELNHYFRAVLCHAISLLIAYIPYAYVYIFQGDHYRITILLVVTIAYIFILSAFLWLNVLAFELWRGFSKIEIASAAGRNISKVRHFLMAFKGYATTINLLHPK